MEILTHTWHWSIAGFLIAMVMLMLNYFGKVFGMSSNLRSLCSMTGVGKKVAFFDWDWKSQRWNLTVVLGAMIGGYVAVHFLSDASNVAINPKTIEQLAAMHIDAPNGKLLPDSLFGNQIFHSPKMIAILLVGGLLIGFGSRYAGGCTSGHAIAGMSNFAIAFFESGYWLFYWRFDYVILCFTLTFLSYEFYKIFTRWVFLRYRFDQSRSCFLVPNL